MSNHSVSTNQTQSEELYQEVFKVLWMSGIAVSLLGLLTQLGFYILVQSCRKFDEKILTELTVARIVNTVCEFCIINVQFKCEILMDIVYVLYFHTDFVLLCWMFVFTKNLHNKIVSVFVYKKCNLVYASLFIWIASLPISLVVPFLMKRDINEFTLYYKIYAHIKFIILIINALIFFEIFSVALRRGFDNTRNVKHFLKTAVVAFILVCITSLQVLTTDLLSYFIGENEILIISFCVINSYQVFAVTIIFIILAKSTVRESVLRTMSIRLWEIVS